MTQRTLEKEKHIKYWQRCLKSLLPTAYTSTDSSRMTLAFFILSALDLLGVGSSTFPEHDRARIREWILKSQHPNGGFCGSPNHRFPDQYYVDVGSGVQQMDPANLPATFFALLSLSFVGGLDRVNRVACLKWLKTLQRKDGSFGELVTQDGDIEGGRDMRYCQTATAVRWILTADEEEKEEDIDIEGLVDYIRAGQTYDGGFSESSEHEAHAGYTYCAIAALSFLGRLPNASLQTKVDQSKVPQPGLTDRIATIGWLLSRQVGYIDEDEEDEEEDEVSQEPIVKLAGVYKDDRLVIAAEDHEFVGLNGRCNKPVDTCYSFWVAGSLSLLGKDEVHLLNVEAIRRFLFEQTQHVVGGFGKVPGNPPDIYHSYLGLAALAIMKEPGIKSLDPGLCISIQQKEIIEQFRRSAAVPTRTYWKHGYCFSIREDDPDFENIMASSKKPQHA
ncbi:terpenoid cyclases/protein prenyltransferase alpha-alpha toroid [Leptodontidium sp. 2 PMI_412]|nr:terpenoid cyclases/protein prenyltransferase alpha-alpha toroid [Leptodontidium sp. MPI-SDFR-AT-0119]KAH9221602.1 terpenoid cyclases/protein prenyltransferase alpha-alpha toroid [Leptodontidium sp. 2 PMI_412]